MSFTKFAVQAATSLGIRCAPSSHLVLRSLAVRSFSNVPEGQKYASSHEWVKVEDGVGTVGITDFAQSELGDVVYVDLPEVGSDCTAKQPFGVVESVKAASDVYSPVSGEVVEVNGDLTDDPSLVNTSSYEGGWMMKVKLSDPSELDSLLDAEGYSKAISAASE